MFNKKIINILTISMVTLILGITPSKAATDQKESISEAVKAFTPQVNDMFANKHNESLKFTDGEAAPIYVEPINNVNEYLPEEIYPNMIKTNELLSLVNPKTKIFKVIDLQTQKSFNAVRYGGNKHLDAEPLTNEDADILNSINGHSWDRQDILINVDNSFYAASMNTMPHGNGYVSANNYNGHFCIHVLDSKTHGGNSVCPLHQAKIQKASKTEIAEIVNTISAK